MDKIESFIVGALVVSGIIVACFATAQYTRWEVSIQCRELGAVRLGEYNFRCVVVPSAEGGNKG